nr:hypothetical protein [Tanacetum cinerariifolium]
MICVFSTTTTKKKQTKRILKKSKKPETQVDTEVLDNRLTRLEKKVEAMSRFNIPEAIDKFVKAHLMKKVLPKGAMNFGEIRQEKATMQRMPKYSSKSFDKDSLMEYDQKDKLLKMMTKFESYDKHPAHKALYNALVKSLIVDKDEMDKQLKDQSTPKKRRRDGNDQDPAAGSEKEKKKRESKKIVHDVEMDVAKSIEEDVVDAEDPSQADASVPKSYK